MFLILRPDHNLQDIRSKIFPLKRRKINAPEALPSMAIPPPVKRKERSLSSLGFIAPKVSTQIGTTGKRTKAFARRVSRGPSFINEEQSKKRADFAEDMAVGSSSLDSLDKLNKKQVRLDKASWDLCFLHLCTFIGAKILNDFGRIWILCIWSDQDFFFLPGSDQWMRFYYMVTYFFKWLFCNFLLKIMNGVAESYPLIMNRTKGIYRVITFEI